MATDDDIERMTLALQARAEAAERDRDHIYADANNLRQLEWEARARATRADEQLARVREVFAGVRADFSHDDQCNKGLTAYGGGTCTCSCGTDDAIAALESALSTPPAPAAPVETVEASATPSGADNDQLAQIAWDAHEQFWRAPYGDRAASVPYANASETQRDAFRAIASAVAEAVRASLTPHPDATRMTARLVEEREHFRARHSNAVRIAVDALWYGLEECRRLRRHKRKLQRKLRAERERTTSPKATQIDATIAALRADLTATTSRAETLDRLLSAAVRPDVHARVVGQRDEAIARAESAESSRASLMRIIEDVGARLSCREGESVTDAADRVARGRDQAVSRAESAERERDHAREMEDMHERGERELMVALRKAEARATRAEEQLARVRELWSILGIRRTPSGMLRVVTGVNESDAFDLINAALSTPPAPATPVETVEAVAEAMADSWERRYGNRGDMAQQIAGWIRERIDDAEVSRPFSDKHDAWGNAGARANALIARERAKRTALGGGK